jgi:hypothetical protein
MMQSAQLYGNAAGRNLPFRRVARKAAMPYNLFVIGMVLLLAGTAGVSAASVGGNTVSVTNPLDAAALVYISGYEITPEVFYPGDTGTVTVHVTNAANTSVSVSQPNLIESHVRVINSAAFATATTIGPGETIDYTFVIRADGSDGTYLPLFTVSTTAYGAGAIHSQIKLRIDSTDVRASISKKPDTFALSTKDMVNVSVVNPRAGEITNVLIVPEVNGAIVSPDESFVGILKAGTSVQVPFAITPEKESAVIFHVSYYNGDNRHTTDVVLPLTLGKNKQGAEIVVNNIESSNSAGTITLKGDVTNNGLTDARSVLVTVESPATPINPNPVYAIGNLEPDDFASFEVTYTQTAPGAVPIVVEYKDSDGNVFTKKFTMNSNLNAGSAGASSVSSGIPQGQSGTSANRRPGGLFSFGSGLNQVPVTEIVIVLLAIIALVIAWRKGLIKRLTDRFRKKQDPDDEIKEQ